MNQPTADGAVGQPSTALASYVAFYSGYDWRGGAPGRHRGLPASHLNIVVTFETPLRVGPHVEAAQGTTTSYAASVSGLHLDPVGIQHDGRMDGIFVALRPRGARALLGVPAAALVSGIEDLEVVLGPSAEALRDRLASAETWQDRFAVLDAEFTDRVRAVEPVIGEADRIWERVVSSGGQQPVAEIARDLGWSRRHLGTLFRHEFGLSPKSLARILRFERSRSLIEASPHLRLADVAVACGFADHAHLTREWNDLAGCPPRTWVAEELTATAPVRSA